MNFSTHISTHIRKPIRPTLLFSIGVLAGFSTQQARAASVPENAPATQVAVASAPAAVAQAPLSNASHLDDYKRDIARWISGRSDGQVYTTQPQALLRGIVVLNIQIGPDGTVRSVRMIRTPGDAELEKRAIDSVWRASPFPRPNEQIARGQRTLDFSETWLFNNDGRFQLRTIALTQKTTNF